VSAAIVVDGLHVAFGDTRALAGVDVRVDGGTTTAVLGHNGAGKTTLIRAISTLVRPGAGHITVDGFDVVAQPDEVRQRIGVTGQYAGLDDFLTGRENLELLGRLAGLGKHARRRATELIERLSLRELADRRAGEMSGGSRRRIDLAASLVGSPTVLILDEPTTGLDPVARNELWHLVEELNDHGTTVLLTTQYLEEADRLADTIVMLTRGRVVANGTPGQLKKLIGDKVIATTIPTSQLSRLPISPDSTHDIDPGNVRITYLTNEHRSPAHVIADLTAAQVDLDELDVSSPSLDDVFALLSTNRVQP
jgi:ABC-2 type transport system ATP-binding protein